MGNANTTTPVRRNATRKVAELKASHTEVTVYTSENYFLGQKVADAAPVWDRWMNTHHATMRLRQDGTLTMTLHGNCWYELREPMAVRAARAAGTPVAPQLREASQMLARELALRGPQTEADAAGLARHMAGLAQASANSDAVIVAALAAGLVRLEDGMLSAV